MKGGRFVSDEEAEQEPETEITESENESNTEAESEDLSEEESPQDQLNAEFLEAVLLEEDHSRIESLLKSKAEINTKDKNGDTVLLMAAMWQGHSEIVRLLIEHGADVTEKTLTGETPLIIAAANGDLDTVIALTAHLTPEQNTHLLNLKDSYKYTALMWAITNDFDKIVAYFVFDLKTSIPKNERITAALNFAIKQSSTKTVNMFITRFGINIFKIHTKQKENIIMMAARQGSFTTLVTLFSLFKTSLALDHALRIKNGENETALMLAVKFNCPITVGILASHLNIPTLNAANAFAETALMMAAMNGCTLVIRTLIALPYLNKDAVDLNGMTALMMAVQNGHAEVAMLLAQARARLDLKNASGKTAILLAIEKRDSYIATKLSNFMEHEQEAHSKNSKTELSALSLAEPNPKLILSTRKTAREAFLEISLNNANQNSSNPSNKKSKQIPG